ncbi:hypothetical protein CBER1_05167 [Cercospora berteroae]|uniref:Rad21/Rec8-like protein N-terminal domain-containing protein n=1 Tax=Cercospora berteroae TaxID=357750 RepID=A0A2S6C3E8_9PEZI|nr:hypothetical protein CBER1_05167 [Cercospora berteroae]
MFYSHEVLTSRKYGVATVWLVATLGAKSTLKKVSRKAILNVDVAKACETIITPEAPMALRLQSSLLYGVTRVYLQQCGYVLTDVEAARNNLRAISRVMKQAELEVEGANKARADQLQLPDDPDFVPDFAFMPDPDNLDIEFNEETQQLSQSPGGSRRSITNGSQQSIGGLVIPSSNNSFVGGPVGGTDLFSVRGDSGPGTTRVPAQLLDDDDLGLDMGFDEYLPGGADGSVPQRQPRGSVIRADPTDPISEARKLTSEPPDQPMFGQDDDEMPAFDDFNNLAGEEAQDQIQDMTHQETTSESASAPNVRSKRPAKAKNVQMDHHTSMTNRDLAELNKNYLDRMLEEGLKHQRKKLNANAKKNAEQWVLGAGSILGQGMRGPLDMFSGAALLEAFTGVNLMAGKKRARDEDGHSSDSQSKRSRVGESSDEVGRADDLQMGDDFMMMGDDTIEQGREAPTPLDDRHLSSLLPWNQSQGSRRPTDVLHPTSASFGGGPQINVISRRGSRLTSASPLIGRGVVGNELDDFQLPPGSDIHMSGLNDEEEFELYGTAAQVDTQTAAQTQWQKAALTGKSANFLDFVQTAIDEHDDPAQLNQIEFEKLLPPQSNTYIVAAQALLHVLALGTTGALKVEQDEPFGPIALSITAGVL